KCIISTAPMPKLGAMRTLPAESSVSQERTVSTRDGSKPEVPTTTCRPRSTHHLMLSITTPGWVKSTTTSAAVSASNESPWSTAATSSMSSADRTARHTSEPMRPRAPSTPTLITCSPPGRSCASSLSSEALAQFPRLGVRRAASGLGVGGGEVRAELDRADVGDPGPAQPALQERGLVVGPERRRAAVPVHGAGVDDGGLLAAQETRVPAFGIEGEHPAGLGHDVDELLEDVRDAGVPHRDAEQVAVVGVEAVEDPPGGPPRG